MKSPKLFIAALLLLALASCKKTPIANTATVSSTEASKLIGSSLLYGSNGVASTFSDAVDVAGSLSLSLSSTGVAGIRPKNINSLSLNNAGTTPRQLQCGTTLADSLFREGAVGAADYYTYNTIYNFTLNCNNSAPDNITATSTFQGDYIGIYAISTDTGSSSFKVSGLPSTDTALVFTGTYKRSGAFQSKVDTTNHGNYNITVTINSLSWTKPAVTHLAGYTLTGGTGTVSITGYVPKKGNFSYTGTLVFGGGALYTATLTIGGTVYTIALNTGIVTLKI